MCVIRRLLIQMYWSLGEIIAVYGITHVKVYIVANDVNDLRLHNFKYSSSIDIKNPKVIYPVILFLAGARPASIFDKKRQKRSAYTKTDQSGYTKPFGAQ